MVKQVTVYIASHYREDREDILGDVLDALAGWTNAILRVTVMSNVPTYDETGLIARKAPQFQKNGSTLSLEVVEGLANPRHLTWAHKKHIPAWIESAAAREDLFVYIEDDILITDANFQYFLSALDEVKPKGLIPGFLRYEKAGGDEIRLVDQIWPEYWERDRTRKIGGKTYHACINPYWAGYILDRDLAEEYVASDSADLRKSEKVHDWTVMARAAMGLTYENPPKDLRTRIVIPLVDGMPHPDCLVWHRANNYTDNPNTPNAKKTPQDIFRTETYGAYLARQARRAAKRIGA